MTPTERTARAPDPQRPESVSALEALAGLAIAGTKGLEQVRLSATVAATLRAALEVVLGEGPLPRPLLVSWDDGALDVACPVPAAGDLAVAGTLLESVEGSVGRTEETRAWTLRVPVLGARGLYLMLHQGTLPLAVPWHAVLRVRLAKRSLLDAMARRAGYAVLSPFVSVAPEAEERLAVLVGYGLRRAFLLADRLVWRMPAEPVESMGHAPEPDLARGVRTSEGETYWVADPARLLRHVAPPPVPEPQSARPTHAPAPRSDPAPGPQREETPPPVRARGRLVELRREDVEPLSGRESQPMPVATAARRALIADDSIIGRIFLQRLLELRGFTVEDLGNARELAQALRRGPWAVVFADVGLPDSPGGDHLSEAVSVCSASGWPLVALVRDAADEGRARSAGAARMLRKPFEQEPLHRLLRELDLGGAS